MPVEYRVAKPTDLKVLLPLTEGYARDQESQMSINTLQENFMEYARSGIAQAVQHPAACVMIAEEISEEGAKPQAVGYAVAMVQEPPAIFEPEMYLYITDLYVKPEFRRQGVATALIERVRGWGWVNGVNRFSLVLPTNSAAHGLYAKIGFKPIQTMLYFKDEA
jgi:ribosomal protein S18 acetylase RimI-like enzyme